jgi:hypothetical protein
MARKKISQQQIAPTIHTEEYVVTAERPSDEEIAKRNEAAYLRKMREQALHEPNLEQGVNPNQSISEAEEEAKPRQAQKTVTSAEGPSEAEQAQTTKTLEEANLLAQQAKALKSSRLGSLFSNQLGASEGLYEEPSSVTFEPTTVTPASAGTMQSHDGSHVSIPRLRATLTQLLMELPENTRGTTVYGDTEKMEVAPIALKLLDTLAQIKNLDPSIDLRSVAEQTQSPDGYFDLSPLVEGIENGSLGDDIANYWSSILNPVDYKPVLGERSEDFDRHVADMVSNPNVKTLNDVGLVVKNEISDNPLKEGGSDIEDMQPSGSDGDYNIMTGSKSDQTKGTYSIMNGYTGKGRKNLNSLKAKLGRAEHKLKVEYDRIRLHKLKTAIKNASDTNKMLKASQRGAAQRRERWREDKTL